MMTKGADMTFQFEDAMKEVMAEYEKSRADLARLQESVEEVSGKARSKSRIVAVTVDGRGEVTELKFHSQAWRTMPPGELSKVIVQTIKDAQKAAQQAVWAAVREHVPTGLSVPDGDVGPADWSAALPATLEPPAFLRDLLAQDRRGGWG
jgi:DNA-binding protein YbaB